MPSPNEGHRKKSSCNDDTTKPGFQKIWAAVARNGLRQSARPPITKAASVAQNYKKPFLRQQSTSDCFFGWEKKMRGEMHR
ncbi:hypothetical protein K3495_g230 [Podosphaera aphanis]|nr:hypothetical protein K3495_g230 [Podosphaera aphanis]